QELFGREGVISFMTAVVDDMAKIDYYTAQIIETGAAQVSTDDELLAHVLSIVASVNITLQVVAAVALVAAVFGIVNTMMTAVYERRREIGILRAIGSKRRTIFVLFMLESAMYGLFGGLLGVALGMLASVFAGDFISQIGANDLMKGAAPAAELSLSLTLTAVGFSLALAMISGVLPALRASKLTPVEAISHE
ncbi:MAG: FtsX-like permease family protein, partial [Oscillospiraceae bacterium]|nr:FtsX-like permease family protein [Oscillospiraceae bacterium]